MANLNYVWLFLIIIVVVLAIPFFEGNDNLAQSSILQKVYCKVAVDNIVTGIAVCQNANDTIHLVQGVGILMNITGNQINITSIGGVDNQGTNVGAGAAVYKTNIAPNLIFRSLIGSGAIITTQNANDITFSLGIKVNNATCPFGFTAFGNKTGFTCGSAVPAITSINGDGTAAQTIAGTSNNVTVTNAGATHTINLGSNVVTTSGQAQTISKGLTTNSLTLGGTLDANNHLISNLAIPISANDAQKSNHLGLLGNLVTTICSDQQTLKYNAGNTTWICTSAGTGTLTSINGDGTAAQIISGQSGNTTITDVGATHTVGLGINPVITGGSAQVITKGITTNALTLGGNEAAGGFKITNLGTPSVGTDSARMNTIGNNALSPFGNPSDGQVLTYQNSNTTAIWKTIPAMATQVLAPSYIIYKSGSTYYAENGTSGMVEFSSTNASSVIQSAQSKLPSTGGKIEFRTGTFPVHIIPQKSSTVFIGQGHSTLLTRDGNNIIFDIRGNNFSVTRITIENMLIDGSPTSYLTDCIFANQTNYLKIIRSTIQGCGANGIYLEDVHDSRILDDDFNAAGNTTNNKAGIYLYSGTIDNTNNIYITNVKMETMSGTDIISQGLNLASNANNNIVIDGSKFESHNVNVLHHLNFSNTQSSTITNSLFSSAITSNIYLDSTNRDSKIIGNWFISNLLGQAGQPSITLYHIDVQGIGTIITNNKFTLASTADIKVGTTATHTQMLANYMPIDNGQLQVSGTTSNVIGGIPTGSFGIGTTDPTFQLHEVANNTAAFLTIDSYNANPILLGRSTGGTQALPTPTPNGANLLFIGGRGYSNGAFETTGPAILISASQTHSAGNWGSAIIFGTVKNGATARTSNFGIGNDGTITMNNGKKFDLGGFLAVSQGLNYFIFNNNTGTQWFSNNIAMITVNGSNGLQTINLNSMNTTNLKLGTNQNANNFKIINLNNATLKNDAVNARQLGLLGNLTYGSKCSDQQTIKYQSSNQTWICVTGGAGTITSINGDGSAAQTLSGTSRNVTVTNAGATHTFNLGDLAVVTNGLSQNITKTINMTRNFHVDSATFNVDSTNHRVGIGTASPSFTAQIYGNQTGPTFDLEAQNANPLFIGRQAGGTGAKTATGSGQALLFIQGRGYTGSAFENTGASIIIETTQAHTASANGEAITFSTIANGATARTSDFRIGNDGTISMNNGKKFDLGGFLAVSQGKNYLIFNNATGIDLFSGSVKMFTANGTNTNIDFFGNTLRHNSGTEYYRNPAGTFGYTLATSAIIANRTLTLPLTTQTETLAVQPTLNFTSPANQTGTLSTVPVMLQGFATFTPKVTGRIEVSVSGYGTSTLLNDGCRVDVRYGTSYLGNNGAVLTGTLAGTNIKLTGSASQLVPFSKSGIQITGLTVGTKYFIDLSFAAVGGGTCNINNVDWGIREL